jgi:Xaa-Pro dipeptidase
MAGSITMHQEQRDRTHQLLKRKNITRALFANPANITWLTGFARPWKVGADLYAGGSALVWYEDGIYTLIVMDAQVTEAEEFATQANCQVISYQGYSYEEQPAGFELLASALKDLVRGSQSTSDIGIETQHLSQFLSDSINQSQSNKSNLVPIDNWLNPLRITRTSEELDKMRQNLALIKVGQNAARDAVKVGNLELDVWYAIHQAMQQSAEHTLPLGNDCTVGRRMGGHALAVEILPDDSFIVDLSTQLHGYWSDSCVTYYATEPSPKQIKMHRTVAHTLDLAISLARPGAIAKEIDQAVRQFIIDAGYASYPHHTGHGIGVIGHEAPRIVPHSDEVLQKGMVIMLEPGIYYPNETGVRLEHAVLITDDGAEILTQYDLNIP